MTRAALTPRELEVAHLLDDGQTQKQVASSLGISVRTVEDHVAAIRRKMDRPTTAAALARAIRRAPSARGRTVSGIPRPGFPGVDVTG